MGLVARASGLQSTDSTVAAQLLCGMWDTPSSGIKPVSPALANGFFIPEPPGEAQAIHS